MLRVLPIQFSHLFLKCQITIKEKNYVLGGRATLNDSLNKPISFNDERYILIRNRKLFFFKWMDCDIQVNVNNGPCIPTCQVNNIMENKSRELWTKEDKEYVEYNLKAKTNITAALGIYKFFFSMLHTLKLLKKCGAPFKLPIKVQSR